VFETYSPVRAEGAASPKGVAAKRRKARGGGVPRAIK
jgi:hypothetical protein